MSLTLRDLLGQPDLGLELVAGARDVLRRPVAGAHSIEIAEPTRWLDRNWVLLTTGIRLRGDAAAQRRLVAECEAKPLAAIGFGLDVVYRSVPNALLEEARRRNFPLFTIAHETPFREIVGFVDRALASTDFRLLRRRIGVESSLVDALASDDPEEALVRRLGSLVDASVILYRDGRASTSVGAAPRDAIWRELCQHPDRTELTVGRWTAAVEPVGPGGSPGRWLVIATRGDGVTEGLTRAVLNTAARLLGVLDLAREATRAGERTLRAELLDHVLDPGRTADVPPGRFESFGFDPGADVLLALVDAGPAGSRPGSPGRAASIVEMAAARSGAPCIVARRRGLLTLLFQERSREAEAWVGRLAAEGFEPLAGIGRPFPVTGRGAAASLRDAELALEQLRRPGESAGRRSLRYADFGLSEWLLASADPRAADEKAEALLGGLRPHPDLMETLLALLRHDLSVPRTARSLHLHQNSLRYRIGRIEDVLGRSLREVQTIADLHLATAGGRGEGLLAEISSSAPG